MRLDFNVMFYHLSINMTDPNDPELMTLDELDELLELPPPDDDDDGWGEFDIDIYEEV